MVSHEQSHKVWNEMVQHSYFHPDPSSESIVPPHFTSPFQSVFVHFMTTEHDPDVATLG